MCGHVRSGTHLLFPLAMGDQVNIAKYGVLDPPTMGVNQGLDEHLLVHGDERSDGEPLLYREVQCEARVLSAAPGTKCLANGAHAALPLTPAPSKVAISVNRASAARTRGSAIAAPVPSPRRMSRFSSASTPRCASSARWACSA